MKFLFQNEAQLHVNIPANYMHLARADRARFYKTSIDRLQGSSALRVILPTGHVTPFENHYVLL